MTTEEKGSREWKPKMIIQEQIIAAKKTMQSILNSAKKQPNERY